MADAGGLIPAHAGKTRDCGERRWGARAHPRSRGENSGTMNAGPGTMGSSPLTRGKQGWPELYRRPSRLIPAHAGKTAVGSDCAHERRAHPRSRGENIFSLRARISSTGSSPLTRGKPIESKEPAAGDRLIPAHAGKTASPRPAPLSEAAHPRSRGENLHPLSPIRLTEGSSPLTRGKPRGSLPAQGMTRLIPAHAGKTVVKSAKRWPDPAHPRSRGENLTTPIR